MNKFIERVPRYIYLTKLKWNICRFFMEKMGAIHILHYKLNEGFDMLWFTLLFLSQYTGNHWFDPYFFNFRNMTGDQNFFRNRKQS